MKKAIGIATSDWHFWHVAPVWRSNEKNWLEAMGRQLFQVLQASLDYECDVFMAGDVFDHYNPVPETINYLKKSLAARSIYAVPGQHDLEHHCLEHLEKTGFETLEGLNFMYFPCQLYYNAPANIQIYFAPWGTDLNSIKINNTHRDAKSILLAHKYVWFDENTRYGGSEIPTGKLTGLKEVLQQFDFAIFGDNHIPFRKKIGKCQVINPGTLVKRKIDERDYKTGYTIMFDDGNIEFHEFDTSEDKYLEIQVTEPSNLNVSSREFMDRLRAMEGEEIDYRTEIENKLRGMNRPDMEKQFTEIFDKYGA